MRWHNSGCCDKCGRSDRELTTTREGDSVCENCLGIYYDICDGCGDYCATETLEDHGGLCDDCFADLCDDEEE